MINVQILQNMRHYVSCVIKQTCEVCDKNFSKEKIEKLFS